MSDPNVLTMNLKDFERQLGMSVQEFEDKVKRHLEEEERKEIPPLVPGDQLQRGMDYDVAVALAKAIFEERNAAYGDSFVYGGLMGIAGELSGTGRRLEKILLQDPPLFQGDDDHALLPQEQWEEKLRNIFVDSINYAVMGLILMRYEIYHGKR